MPSDGMQMKVKWRIGKFKSESPGLKDDIGSLMTLEEIERKHESCFLGHEEIDGNMAVSVGIKAVIYWMCNGAGGGAGLPSAPSPANLFNNANARLMTGTGSGGAAEGNLYSTFTAPVYAVMESGYPNMNGSHPWIVTWRASFGNGIAEQAWNEFAVANAGSTPVILNRVVSSKGTKGTGETWVLEVAITFQ